MSALPRRAALGAILVAPLASVPALATPSDLARACDWAMAHVAWINGTCHAEQWDDARVTAELARYNAAFRRAADEPSASLNDLKAKARLLLSDLVENGVLPGSDDTLTDDERLTQVVLAEIIAL